MSLDSHRHPVLIAGRQHGKPQAQHLRIGPAHHEPLPRSLEHLVVVPVVADREGLRRGQAEALLQKGHAGGLADVGMEHVQDLHSGARVGRALDARDPRHGAVELRPHRAHHLR